MNDLTSSLIRNVIGFLNRNADYAVMRNFEGLPHNNEARDIDIIISKKDFKKVRKNLTDIFVREGWKIIVYLNSDRLISYVCARNDGNETSIIQWDFFFDTSVYGIKLMDASEFLKDKEFNGFLWHLKKESQFLDKYLYDRAVNTEYPEKYTAIREAAENSANVKDKLVEIFGCTSTKEIDKIPGKKLLRRALRYNIKKRPIGLTKDILNFLRTFSGNYIKSRTGFSIGFTGPDGSGKTTVIDLTIERLGDVFRTAHTYNHFRPALFGNISDVAHAAGMKKEVDKNYSQPHRGGKTSALSSLARLGYYSIDYILGYFLKVKTQTRITRLVIFDRYFTDIICDSRRSRIYLPLKLLNLWRNLFIPSLDYNILLTASPEVILSRKEELSREGIEEINRRIDYLAAKKGYYKILNEKSPEDAVTEILNLIFERQHHKNLKR